jgi:hypothetical protein
MNNLTVLTRRMSTQDALTMYIVLRKDLIKVSLLQQTHLKRTWGGTREAWLLKLVTHLLRVFGSIETMKKSWNT